jgi:DNA-binding SARP family transcriptional activator
MGDRSHREKTVTKRFNPCLCSDDFASFEAVIRLQLLGGLDVTAEGLAPDSRVHRRGPLALLALVAAASPQPIAREKVMALLWPESDTERASNSLRQTLFWLRRELHSDLFIENVGGIQLDRSRLSVDLWQFRDAMDRRSFDEAASVYGGPFLDGFQIPGSVELSQWAENERDFLERQYLEAMDALATSAIEENRYDDVVAWRRRQAAVDPFSSRVALALLRALVAAGDRPGALEYAAVYENIVRTHLEIDPDPSVTAFVDELRSPSAAIVPMPKPLRRQAAQALEYSANAGSSPARWMMVGAALTIAAVLLAAKTFYKPEPDTTIVVASGTSIVEGKDTSIMLVACEGPACPKSSLPQPAFVVPKHPAWAAPNKGTRYIASVVDGGEPQIDKTSGYQCCTTATFEKVFALPKNATSARAIVSLLADNRAWVSINGREFGRQAEPYGAENYAGPPATYSVTFAPDPSGLNRLRVTLWDGRGALGVYFHGVVTYETAETQTTSSR